MEDRMNKVKCLLVVFLLFVSIGMGFSGCQKGTESNISPVDFYKGKTIEMVTTTTPGAVYDLVARHVVSYLAQDTGSFTVTNNKQASGGNEGVHYLIGKEPDGLTLASFVATKLVGNKIMKEPEATYDIEKFSYLMGIGAEPAYFFVSTDGLFQSVSDLEKAVEIKIGGSAPSGSVSLSGLTIIKLLNLDAKLITGIESESDRALAVKRGEIVGYCISLSTARSSMAANLVKPLFVLSSHRDVGMPDIPAITELEKFNEEDMDLIRLWETSFASSNIIAATPDIPQDRLKYLRELCNKHMNDKVFRDEINKIMGYELKTYKTGEEVSQNMLSLAQDLDDVYAIFAELITKYRE
jgi:tripartite-type tricarboxylate transporter receptor subunit TctC